LICFDHNHTSYITKMHRSSITKTYFLEWKLLITLKIYEDAINHCRWKKVLRNVIKTELMFQEHYLHQLKGKSFDEILLFVYDTCCKVKGIGMLIIYDITSAICRYNKINIERVYVVGNGPKRAINLLDIKTKSQKFGKVTLKYVEILEILKAFQEKKYEIDLQIKNSNNGDDFETYICNWQKNK